MCVVSMVLDYGRTIPPERWRPDTWRPYKQLIEQAKEFDRIAEQPDCDDPEKARWMADMEKRVLELEKKELEQRIRELERQAE